VRKPTLLADIIKELLTKSKIKRHKENTMKFNLTLFLSLFSFFASGQTQKTEVLTLGTFHFAFPNLDIKKVENKDQIDVLEPEYQKEIEEIVKRISKFRPTIIAIERDPNLQSHVDSLYDKYLKGEYQLRRNEEEQIGFRLAKASGLKKLYCVDDGGTHYDYINSVLEGKDSLEKQKFMNFFYKNPDSLYLFYEKPIFKTKGVVAELRRLNNDRRVKGDLGNYLIGVFKYEMKENDFFGPDFVTGWWFNRNLRIFRNIQKINAKPADRILIIYGAGHLNILNPLYECSPEYKLVRTNDFLK
jgi:hypothetical protein